MASATSALLADRPPEEEAPSARLADGGVTASGTGPPVYQALTGDTCSNVGASRQQAECRDTPTIPG